jgi:hypothetical protein
VYGLGMDATDASLIVKPATSPGSIGVGNTPVKHNATSEPSSNRMDELGNEQTFEPGRQSFRLAAETEGIGVQAVMDVDSLQGMPTYVEIPQVGRPSYPLPVTADGSDRTYSAEMQETIDVDYQQYIGTSPHETMLGPDRPLLSERSRGTDDRPSTFAMAIDRMIRPFDKVMGAWPWSGDKAMQERPTAQLPPYYAEAIAGGVPSPGGSFATVPNTAALTPQRMTFRLTPTPWDQTYTDPGLARIPGVQSAGE